MKTKNEIYNIANGEIRIAYADCHMSDFEKASKIRNLNFKSSVKITVKEAIRIFTDMDKNFTYNEFSPSLLKHLGEDTLITVAREGSVCVYVHAEQLVNTSQKLREIMKADEFGGKAGQFRIWWD